MELLHWHCSDCKISRCQCSLDWKDHIKVMSSKVPRAIDFLKHVRNFFPQDALKTLYTGIVEPHFLLLLLLLGLLLESRIHPITKLQNQTSRIVTNSSYDAPSKPLFQILGWKIIEERIADDAKMIVFKSVNDLDHITCTECSLKVHIFLNEIFETLPLT